MHRLSSPAIQGRKAVRRHSWKREVPALRRALCHPSSHSRAARLGLCQQRSQRGELRKPREDMEVPSSPCTPQLSSDREDTVSLSQNRFRQGQAALNSNPRAAPDESSVKGGFRLPSPQCSQGESSPLHSSGLGFCPFGCLERQFLLLSSAPEVNNVPVRPDGCLGLTLGSFTASSGSSRTSCQTLAL